MNVLTIGLICITIVVGVVLSYRLMCKGKRRKIQTGNLLEELRNPLLLKMVDYAIGTPFIHDGLLIFYQFRDLTILAMKHSLEKTKVLK